MLSPPIWDAHRMRLQMQCTCDTAISAGAVRNVDKKETGVDFPRQSPFNMYAELSV